MPNLFSYVKIYIIRRSQICIVSCGGVQCCTMGACGLRLPDVGDACVHYLPCVMRLTTHIAVLMSIIQYVVFETSVVLAFSFAAAAVALMGGCCFNHCHCCLLQRMKGWAGSLFPVLPSSSFVLSSPSFSCRLPNLSTPPRDPLRGTPVLGTQRD